MKLELEALRQLDMLAAVDSVLDTPSKLLPPSAFLGALHPHRQELAAWVEQGLLGGFVPTLEEIIPVNKSSHGVRPVAVWDLPSKITYTAMVDRAGRTLPPLDRDGEQWIKFQRRPLDLPGSYIVASDIASFYQYIDHGLLRDELLIRGCDPTYIESALALVRETTGRAYGLPQQSHSSDLLAEAFLGRLHRALVRRGLEVVRYNDDLRFVCRTWSDTVRVIETLAEESRLMGLSINDLKTVTWKRERYEESLDRADALKQEITREAELELTDFEIDGYDNTVTFVRPESSEVEVLGATRILEQWSDLVGQSADVPEQDAPRYRALVQLLPLALRIVQAGSAIDSGILDICTRILRFERTITPTVARLVHSCTDHMAVSVFDKLEASNAYLNRWQTWWLQDAVAGRPGFLGGTNEQARKQWLTGSIDTFEDTPSIVAHLGLTLAKHRAIDLDRLLRMYARSTITVRPVLAMAISELKPSDSIRDSIAGDSLLCKWAVSDIQP